MTRTNEAGILRVAEAVADEHPEVRAVWAALIEQNARLWAERDAAVRSVAALFHAYIAITPGETVEGLEPKVQAEAERLLQELSNLQDHYAESINQVAWARGLAESYIVERDRRAAERDEARARLADLARQATAAGPVLENSDEVASAAVDMGDYYHVRADVFEGFLSAVAALRAAREGK